MSKLWIGIIAAGMVLSVGVPPAMAVTANGARQACVKAAAAFHSELQGNVQVRRVKAQKSGYEVNLQVKGVESNCMVTKSGKVRYIN